MKSYLILFLCIIPVINISGQSYKLSSPDGKLSASITIKGSIDVLLQINNVSLLKMENLYLSYNSNRSKEPDLDIKRVRRKRVKEIVSPEIREKYNSLENSYNEVEIRFSNNYGITFRIFNEGIAYRFSTYENDSLTVYSEKLDLKFEEGDSAWFQSSETFRSAYETPYQHDALSGIKETQLCNLPFLVVKKNGTFIMITEADLYDYPGLWLEGSGDQTLSAINPKFPEKYSVTGSEYGNGQVASTYDFIARINGTRDFPWRIIAIAEDEKDLIRNNLVYLLSSPCVQKDISWIKPGTVMFDWWAKHNIYGVDFKAGINTETAKYFIDFCAAEGFRYFLFDDGWSPEDDLLNPVPGLDMNEVTAYAESKGISVMLWMIWHTLERQWEDAFSLFSKWGIKGIKVDFMNRDDQLMVEFYERVANKCAENMMVVDFHGAYKPTGLRRKYPNVLTREALIEFEYNGWTDYDNPDHHNLLPYIRMFPGPMDYIPATLRNSTRENFRSIGDYPMGQGTRAHSIALFVILNSPMTMLPDSPSDYYREKECTEFLAKIPLEWDETLLLKGKISDYTVLARRSGKEWYIGAITDWKERVIDIETDFLGKGDFRLEGFADGLNANSRAEDYKKVDVYFRSGELLSLKLASGGGWVARITPYNQSLQGE
jgi:alpha-glucosidase